MLQLTGSFLTQNEAIHYPLCRVPGDVTTRERANLLSTPSVNEPPNQDDYPNPW